MYKLYTKWSLRTLYSGNNLSKVQSIYERWAAQNVTEKIKQTVLVSDKSSFTLNALEKLCGFKTNLESKNLCVYASKTKISVR